MPKKITFPLEDKSTTEDQINKVIPLINQMSQDYRNLTGFGGDCWAAAYAFNKVVFESQGQVVGAFNKQLYLHAKNPIGHVAVHYLTDEAGEDFVDMQGFKATDDIDSWGMLDSNDEDYIEMFNENGIDITDAAFEEVIWVSYSMRELEQLVDKSTLEKYTQAMMATLAKLEAPLELPIVKMKMK